MATVTPVTFFGKGSFFKQVAKSKYLPSLLSLLHPSRCRCAFYKNT